MADKYQNYQGVVLGYYPIRGKIQICRLICQYLHIPYLDLFFNPQTWQYFKATQTKNWNYQQIPFMRHKDVVVTQTFPICLYLIHQANKKDLLGKSLEDQVKVDMFVWDNQMMAQILCLMITQKQECPEKRKQSFEKFWQQTLKPRLIKLQQQVSGNYFFQYLSIIDFYIYDLFYFLTHAQQTKQNIFPKLIAVYKNVANIPEIIAYESSNKAVKQLCPFQYCQRWKQKCVKGGENKCPKSAKYQQSDVFKNCY